MLEYGETYLSENTRILDEMFAEMSPEAVALAKHMATEDADYEDDAELLAA